MKKMMTALVALFAFVASASAMSYEQARQQALFLTDKMAYELNLTEEQYEAAYEVNLDYLMGVNTQDDLYGVYWERRNLDLSYILLDWQYRMYLDATYFYRPLYWSAGYWHFGIYARYPHRDYFFFGRPHFYAVYRGGHAWHMNGGRSWYHGRTFAPAGRGRNEHFGMHNRFERGDFGRGNRGFGNRNNGSQGFGTQNHGTRPSNNGHPGNVNHGNGNNHTTQPGNTNRGNGNNRGGMQPGGSRPSSTRTTVGTKPSGSARGAISNPRNTFQPQQRNTTPQRNVSGSRTTTPSRSVGSTSPSRGSSAVSTPSRSSVGSTHSPAGGSRSGGSSHGGGSHSSGGHFGGRR